MSRISKERMEKALQQLEVISKDDYTKVKNLANIVKPFRSVLHKTPDDYGMTGWQDIYFPSDDGTSLEGWYIPAQGDKSDKLVLFNYALPMSRAGFQGHFGEPWSNFDAVEIDFVIQMKHLTDAGYNVLAYDLRNHGTSRKHPMSGVSRAVEKGETQGFIKISVDEETKHILGAAILGTGGDEFVHVLLDVMYAKAPYTVVQRAMHIHPTVAEFLPTVLSKLELFA